MILAERHIINKNNALYKECNSICFKSKNLYNYALYLVKKEYEATGKYINYNSIDKLLVSENQVDYRALKAKVAQQTLMLLDKNFKSFFKALKQYKITPDVFTGKPSPPNFLNKTKGRFVATFTQQAISKQQLKKGVIQLSGTNINIQTNRQPKQVRVVSLRSKKFVIEILYEKQEPALAVNLNCAGIDIGLNNLAAVSSNASLKPLIINGKPLKSINQYYNKKLAKLKSKLPHYINKEGVKKQRKASAAIEKLTHKRNCKINDYMHKASHRLTKELKQADISKVVIGKNKQWKTKINIGGKNNQKFVSIPHDRFINLLTYKLRLAGIETICREESYTSKCSFLDSESIRKHETYFGRRIKRGLFKTAK